MSNTRIALKLKFLIARHQLSIADLTVDHLLARAIEIEHQRTLCAPDAASLPRLAALQRDFEEAAACVEALCVNGEVLDQEPELNAA